MIHILIVFRQVMKTNNFISIYDNAITSDQCNEIINYFESDDVYWSVKQTGSSTGGVNKKIKDSQDRYMLIENDGTYQNNVVNNILGSSLMTFVDKYKKENPEINNLNFWKVKPEYNLQKYELGGGYHRLHCENYNTGSFSNVILVWMYYLNTVKEGGGTYFSNFDFTVNAVKGRLVIWPPYWTHMHKGIVSNTSQKYIATGWFCLI